LCSVLERPALTLIAPSFRFIAKNYRHPGNQHLLKLVRDNASSFHLASLSDRKAVAASIVSMIRDRGGRFLRYHSNDNVWRDVDGGAAHYKVMQALRETKPAMDFLKDEVLKVSCSERPKMWLRFGHTLRSPGLPRLLLISFRFLRL
jgi:hypothetical protein